MSEKTVYVEGVLTNRKLTGHSEIMFKDPSGYGVKCYVQDDQIHNTLPVSCDWDAIEKEFEESAIKNSSLSGYGIKKIFEWFKSRITSPPQAECEWSEDKFYTGFEAHYLAEKYNLELRNIDYDDERFCKVDSYNTIHIEALKSQTWQLRKPKTLESKLQDILNKCSRVPVGIESDVIQAIKDVFKEGKCQ